MGNNGIVKMILANEKLEKKFLDQLQLLSEQISDLIYRKDFSKIENLDRQRQIIIIITTSTQILLQEAVDPFHLLHHLVIFLEVAQHQVEVVQEEVILEEETNIYK